MKLITAFITLFLINFLAFSQHVNQTETDYLIKKAIYQNDYSKAISLINKSKRTDTPEMLFWRGYCYDKMDQSLDAFESFYKLLSLPENNWSDDAKIKLATFVETLPPEYQQKCAKVLHKALSDHNKNVRLHAILALSRLGDVSVIPAFSQTFAHETDPFLKTHLILSWQDTAFPGLVPILKDTLVNTDNHDIQRAILTLFHNINTRDVIPPLKVFVKKQSDFRLQNFAIKILVSRNAETSLINLLGSDLNIDAKSDILEGLATSNYKDIQQFFLTAVNNESDNKSKIKLLHKLPFTPNNDILKTLIRITNDQPDKELASEILDITENSDSPLIIDILTKLATLNEPELQLRIINRTEDFDPHLQIPVLKTIFDSTRNTKLRLYVLSTLDEQPDNQVLPILADALEDSSRNIQSLAINILKNIHTRNAFLLLARKVHMINPEIMNQAFWALKHQNNPSVISELGEMLLKEDNKNIKLYIIKTLEEMPNEKTLDIFQKSLVSESNNQVRLYLMNAIETVTMNYNITRPDLLPQVATVLMQDKSDSLRLKAVGTLTKLGGKKAGEFLEKAAIRDPNPVIRIHALQNLYKMDKNAALNIQEIATKNYH